MFRTRHSRSTAPAGDGLVCFWFFSFGRSLLGVPFWAFSFGFLFWLSFLSFSFDFLLCLSLLPFSFARLLPALRRPAVKTAGLKDAKPAQRPARFEKARAHVHVYRTRLLYTSNVRVSCRRYVARRLTEAFSSRISYRRYVARRLNRSFLFYASLTGATSPGG